MTRVNNNAFKWTLLSIKHKINFKCNTLYMYISDAIKFYENSLIQKEKIHTNYVNVIHVIKYWMVEYNSL